MYLRNEARLRDDAHARLDRRVHARRRGGGVPRTRAAGAAAPESVCRDAGKDYLLFAEEGDDYTYGDFEDKQKFKDVVKNATAFEDDFLVAGAWSSTLSWWEFTCDSALGSGSDGAQGWTARAAAAAAAIAVAAL